MEELDTEKDLNCVICGSLKENTYFSMCQSCTPFLYKKQGAPHQKARYRKKWKEKRLLLIEKAGNKCQWCDSKKTPFSIHHPRDINARVYDHIWNTIISELFNKLLEKDTVLAESIESKINFEQKAALKQKLKTRMEAANNRMVEACPNCLSSNIHERTTLLPRYRCSSCKKEFDTLISRFPNNLGRSIKHLETKLQSKGYSNTSVSLTKILGPVLPLIYDEAKKLYDEAVQLLVSEYEEMIDCEVLCKKCHSAARLGYVFCEKCKTHYRRPQYETCFRCHKGKKGEDSNSDWYDLDEDDWEDPDY